MILSKIRRSRNKNLYKRFGPCPECGERAVRNQLHWIWGKTGTYQCDACGQTWAEFDDKRSTWEAANADMEVWDGDPVDVERHDEASRNTLVGKAIGRFYNGMRDVQAEVEDEQEDIELTHHQKAKKNLSNACFILALMAALTIIGIPLAILFLILAVWLTPDPYKQAQVDDDN